MVEQLNKRRQNEAGSSSRNLDRESSPYAQTPAAGSGPGRQEGQAHRASLLLRGRRAMSSRSRQTNRTVTGAHQDSKKGVGDTTSVGDWSKDRYLNTWRGEQQQYSASEYNDDSVIPVSGSPEILSSVIAPASAEPKPLQIHGASVNRHTNMTKRPAPAMNAALLAIARRFVISGCRSRYLLSCRRGNMGWRVTWSPAARIAPQPHAWPRVVLGF